MTKFDLEVQVRFKCVHDPRTYVQTIEHNAFCGKCDAEIDKKGYVYTWMSWADAERFAHIADVEKEKE